MWHFVFAEPFPFSSVASLRDVTALGLTRRSRCDRPDYSDLYHQLHPELAVLHQATPAPFSASFRAATAQHFIHPAARVSRLVRSIIFDWWV